MRKFLGSSNNVRSEIANKRSLANANSTSDQYVAIWQNVQKIQLTIKFCVCEFAYFEAGKN